jgi:hypothetical protein
VKIVSAFQLAASLVLVLAQPLQAQVVEFKTYPVPLYTGPRAAPDFSGSAARFKMFQTAIAEGFLANPIAAGHYTIITVGCGTGCTFNWLGDLRSGRIFEFPIGGEHYQGLRISTSTKDRQITASWSSDASWSDCNTRTYIFDGARFRQIGADVKTSSSCF